MTEDVKRATAAARRKAEAKRPETLDEAHQRLSALKWNDAERAEFEDVIGALKSGEIRREDEAKKLSKREIGELGDVLREKRRDALRKQVVETKPSNYWIVQDVFTLEKLRAMLLQEDVTAWDTETQGLDIFNHKIVGWSVYLPKHDVAAYVPFAHTTGQPQVSEDLALGVAREYLENTSHRTIWHHYKFDGHMFANHGIRVANPAWDTQVVSKLLNEHEPSHRLKDLHAKFVLHDADKAVLFEDLFDDAVIYDKDVILSGIYAAGDAHKTYQLYEFQKPYIDTVDNLKTVWYKIEQPLLAVDLDMERTGFRIDLARMAELEREFEPIIATAEKGIREAFNIDAAFIRTMSDRMGRQVDDFNIQSPEHLAYLIYDVLGVDPAIGAKFKKPLRSTAADVLDAICKDYEDLAPLLRYRQLVKLLSTYIRKIPAALEPATGRLHARFNNLAGDDGSDGTATGRYSSSTYVSGKNSATGDVAKGTNLQNVSSKGEGKEIRKCFIPDDGWIFISSDLSQIEPRVISVILYERYGDSSMRDLYLAGVDLYTTMAMRTFNLAEEFCVDGACDPTGSFQPRKLMKQGVLAYLYGQSARAFARTMKVSEDVAEQFFNGMIAAFPGLKPFRDETIASLLTNGNVAHVQTLFGRKRRFPDYRREYAELKKLDKLPRFKMPKDKQDERRKLWGRCASVERQAINTIVQGSAADVLKQIMIALHRYCVERGYKFHASIHDEVMISVPLFELTPQLIEDVERIMTTSVTFSTPLKSDTVIQTRWMCEVKPKDWDFEKCCAKADTDAA